MASKDKTREQLIGELSELRRKVEKMEKAESDRELTAAALRETEERYRSLVESTEDSIYLVDKDSRYLLMNKKHMTRMGFEKDEYAGMLFSERHSAEETKKFVNKVNRVFETGRSSQYEYKSDRDERYFLQTFSPVKSLKGDTIAVTVISKDVTGRKQVEEAYRESEERFRTLFNQASDSIYLLKSTDEGLIIVDANHVACATHGYTYEGLIGKPLAILDESESRKYLNERTGRLMAGETLTFEVRHVRKDGSTFPVEISAQLIKIADEPYVLAIDRDISERKRMEEELRALSLTDELTGLYNRRGCLTLGEQLLKIANRQKKGVFVLYADVDNLKNINDELGHQTGDQALMDVATILKEKYRESDVIARIGGDEFVVIPVGTSGDSDKLIKSRLQKELDIFTAQINRSYKLSISIGVAYSDPGESCSIEELLTRADKLMYEQKKIRKKNS